MTAEELWRPDKWLGKPVRVGEWLYDRRIPLAVRLFKSDTLWGSGDEEDDPYIRDDRAIECYYLELQVAGDERFGCRRAFLTLDEVERFGEEQLGNSLSWSDRSSG
jgi:hypothetical protein